MVEVEYVGLEAAQQHYGKKQLLYSEMGLLNTLKQYDKYKKLRKQELALKSLLKKVINEAQEEIKKLDKLVPKTKHEKYGAVDISTDKKRRRDLQSEIEEIKRKISELS